MVSVTLHRARQVVPVDGPVIDNGAVAVAHGVIRAVGKFADLSRAWRGPIIDHGQAAILPALVNPHVHLEFSALRGRIPPQSDFTSWLAHTLEAHAGLTPYELQGGIEAGLHELWRFGVGLVGEVSNTGLSLGPLQESGLDYQYFFECLGFHLQHEGPLAGDFPIFLSEAAQTDPYFAAAAHAPYSVSASLFQRVAAWNRRRGRLTALHLAESAEEVEFLRTGQGFFRELLTHRQRWRDDFRPPGCSPVAYMEALGVLGPDTLAAHCLWVSDEDVEILARRQVWVLLCPRSNRRTGAGQPPLARLLRAGVRHALATDSLASTEDYNLFKDMLLLNQEFPEVEVGHLLFLATLAGAQALRRDGELGSLTPGKQAALLAVTLPRRRNFWEALLESGAAGNLEWIATPDLEV